MGCHRVFAFLSTGVDTKANYTRAAAHFSSLSTPFTLMQLADDNDGGDAEPLVREVNPLGRLCALEPVDLKRVAVNTARGREECECQWALTERRTLGSRFERQAAYSSDCSVVLPLRPSTRAATPSGPRLLYRSLRAHGVEARCLGVSTGAEHFGGGAAHLRLVIFVSLRMAASAVAPSVLMSLPPRLRARGRIGTVRE